MEDTFTPEEREAVATIEKHLFSAPYKLMIKDYQEAKGRGEQPDPSKMVATFGQAPNYAGGLCVYRSFTNDSGIYERDDFATYIKKAALAAAHTPGKGLANRLSNRTARTAVMAAFKMFGGELNKAAGDIANGLETGQNVQLRPNPKTKKVDVFLFLWGKEVEQIETEKFILDNFGKDGIAKLSGLFGG